MNPTLMIWLEFALWAALIGVAGLRLSRYGDVIATHTGLSSWRILTRLLSNKPAREITPASDFKPCAS